jgi:hypothetical protein
MKKDLHLEHLSADELLSELIARGVKTGWTNKLQFIPKRVPALQRFSSEKIHQALTFKQFTIYGVDDRKDLFQVADPKVRADADGVVALFNAEDVISNGDGTSRLATTQYGGAFNLCPEEPFINQPLSRCDTGFLVNSRMILTAGHIDNLANKLFIFGFQMASANSPQVFNIPNSQIHRAHHVIAQNDDPNGDDFAIILLEDAVTDHRVLAIRRTGRIEDGRAVQVMGHPRGLPLKFADGAFVTDNSNASFFVANLDTYTHNSGSPVFNSDHVVEGIVVRGADRDFVPVGNCQRSVVCHVVTGQSDCSGEQCTRLTRIAHLIP